jgi:hypothetical protein
MKKDVWTALILFCIGVALAAPFRSRYAYHWDGAEFALAAREYNVALSQPHAPGYFLYVMMGRLAGMFTGDEHAALVWVSVFFGGLLAATMYLLGSAMVDRRVGIAAGLFGLTSPVVWFHSCVALTYVVDAALVCATVLVCWRAMRRGGTWTDALVIGAMLAIVGGVRQQSAPGLGVLVLFAFWKFKEHRLLKLLAAAGMSLALVAAWFVPMVMMSGGLATYLEIVRRHAVFNAPATWAGGGWEALLWNIFFSALFCGNGLMLGVALLAGALVNRLVMNPERKRAWDAGNKLAMQTLAMWLAPMMLLGMVVGFTKQPGYVLSYLPGLLLLAAVAAGQIGSCRFPSPLSYKGEGQGEGRWLRDNGPPPHLDPLPQTTGERRRGQGKSVDQLIDPLPQTTGERRQATLGRPALFVAVTGVVCLVNAFAFLAWPATWDRAFWGLGRTAREIRQHDRQLEETVGAVRANFSPSDTAVCHAGEFLLFGIRHFQLYLPEFEQFQLSLDDTMLTPRGRPMMRVRAGRLEFASGLELTGKRHVVLVVPPSHTAEVFAKFLDLRVANGLSGSAGRLYVLPASAVMQ